MPCCDCQNATAKHFGTRHAEADLTRFQRRGPDPTTHLLLAQAAEGTAVGQSVLEVGGGIGVFGYQLMRRGAARVTLVDLSEGYLDVAKKLYGSAGLGERLQLIHGDFVDHKWHAIQANTVGLDRVVCCYPHVTALLVRAAASAERMVLLSYPRDRWFVRLMVRWQNLIRRLRGNSFRTFIHPPSEINSILTEQGFRLDDERVTPVWCCQRWDRTLSA